MPQPDESYPVPTPFPTGQVCRCTGACCVPQPDVAFPVVHSTASSPTGLVRRCAGACCVPQPDESYPVHSTAPFSSGQACRCIGTRYVPQPDASFPVHSTALSPEGQACSSTQVRCLRFFPTPDESFPVCSISHLGQSCTRIRSLHALPMPDESFPVCSLSQVSSQDRHARHRQVRSLRAASLLYLLALPGRASRGLTPLLPFARPGGTADTGASSSTGQATSPCTEHAGTVLPGIEGSQHGSGTDSVSSTPIHGANVGPALAHLQPEVPFEYVSFDIIRGAIVHFLPHGSGPEDAVRHALQHAPFFDPTWTPTRVHVPGFPQFQLLLLRRHAPVTVLLDTRPLEGEVSVHEIGPNLSRASSLPHRYRLQAGLRLSHSCCVPRSSPFFITTGRGYWPTLFSC